MNENMNPNVNPSFVPKPRRQYTAVEAVYAWLCIIFGYLFCRVFPVVSSPFGGLLFTVSIFFVTAVILKISGAKFTGTGLFFVITALLLQASLILSANNSIHFLSYNYALAVYLYFVYSSLGNCVDKGFSDLIPIDFFKAAFVMPFVSLGCIFRGIGASLGGRGGRQILRILIGVALAFIPTAVIVALLSYDEGFKSIIGSFLDFSFEGIVSQIISIIFAFPIGMYLYGLFISSVDNKLPNSMSRERCDKLSSELKIAPAVTVSIAVLPVFIVYVIFFVSQWQYYVSGFSGVLPAELSYAEYAREGFFQLCTVSFINLLIITAIGIFMKNNGKASVAAHKIISIVLSLCTLVLIATAIAKMAMYISSYGLTPKRVYASWGMLVLAVIFLLVIIKQFIPRFKLIASAIVVIVLLFGALSLSGIDGYIAKYNVDRYLDGSLYEVDVDAIRELGDAGVEQLVRLANELDGKNGTDITSVTPEDIDSDSTYFKLVMALRSYDYSDCGVFSYTVPQGRAKAALEELGITPWSADDFIVIPYEYCDWYY